ncbi:M20 family metallopeptidase [Peptoniphilus equinus]|uniref:Peptidase M20 domain-containing protein 2 n=1 Tax=Peptoniphilus equinus TaxID=3016343 RepID=A0ABY7QTI1_9FIRM|nr:M20 family metallopeptidase [Peptoniphilus equinus]WBW50037.1 M20 family metallopeptidase [Peptoniphilus equinus]
MTLENYIDTQLSTYTAIADDFFDHPELGNVEYHAAATITDTLKGLGFEVTMPLAGLDTAFKGVYHQGQGGPNIGFLVEYDALEGLGHACGHHMQSPSILLAVDSLIHDTTLDNYTITVYGTPAEETTHGKLRMLEEGYLKDIDVALMMHGAPDTTVDIKSLALTNLEVEFKGKSAHAALKPEDGRSAFDAALLSFNGIEFLREHVRDDVKMHYTVLNTPGPANVVPDYQKVKYSLRSYSRDYLNSVETRVEHVIQGAALMAGVDYDIHWGDRLNNKIPSLKLNELVMAQARAVNAPAIIPFREKTGSSDFSNVMYEVPGVQVRVAFVPKGTSSHSQTFLDYGKSKEAHDAIGFGAKILARTAKVLIEEPDVLAGIHEEFEDNKKSMK